MTESNVLPVPMDPNQFIMATALHYGIIRCIDDPEVRGRVLVECPGAFDEGAENWSTWAEWSGNPIGSSEKEGDMGLWWPPVPGLFVLLGFEGGNPAKPYCIPCGAWGDGKPYIPKDAQSQKKKALHMRVLKGEAGHTLLFDDNGKQEAMFLVDWTGAGVWSMCPGKEEDSKSSSPCTASRMRKGKMRETKSVMAQTAPKPSEVIEGGTAVTGNTDLNGQGVIKIAKDGEGAVIIMASSELGKVGPSIVLNSKSKCIFLTAGDTQLVIDGTNGHVYTTSSIIENQPKEDVETPIKKALKAVKEFFGKY